MSSLAAAPRRVLVALALSLVLAGLASLQPVASRSRTGPAVIRAQSARSLALELDRLSRQPELLLVGAGHWDPLGETTMPGAAPLLAPLQVVGPDGALDDGGYRLVQASVSAAQLGETLRQVEGLELVAFIPNRAWLVRASAAATVELDGLAGVRWVGAWSPAFKPSARLADILRGEEIPSGALDGDLLRLTVLLHRGEASESWAAAVEAIAGVELRRTGDRSLHVDVRLSALEGAIVELARRSGVASLELDEMPVPHTDHTIWASQSGIFDADLDDYDTTASLFARGVDGRGLQIVMADSGLDNDHCNVRYSDSLNDVAWNLSPSPSYGLPQEEGELDAQRTRLRKVTGYYVMDGAEPFDGENLHGTTVAAVIAGDNYGHAATGGALSSRPLVRDLGVGQNLRSCERPEGEWVPGQYLRLSDPNLLVDDFAVDDPLIANSYGTLVEHHDQDDGLAPAAQLVVFDIGSEDGSLNGFLPPEQAIRWASQLGGTVYSTTFGGAPCTDCYGSGPAGADRSLWSQRLVLATSSAGNEGGLGTETIGSGYAHAKSVIAVGATSRSDLPSTGTPRPGHDLARFSSRGPASGGLLAPELLMPGMTRAQFPASPIGEDGSGSGDDTCGPGGYVTGTSFSSAALAGAAALVQQYFLDGYYPSGRPQESHSLRPTNALVRALLVNSARNMLGARSNADGTAPGHRPNFGQGWGRPVLDDSLYFEGDPKTGLDPLGDLERAGLLVLTDTPNGLRDLGALTPEPGGSSRQELIPGLTAAGSDGVLHEWLLEVQNPAPGDPAYDLRITLAWSDPDAAEMAGRVTVNDLDLEVVSPSGVVYRTDPHLAWEEGYTLPAVDQEQQEFRPFTGFTDYSDRDSLNTVENVFLPSEDVEAGEWLVRVVFYDVPGNGVDVAHASPNFVDGDGPLDRDTSTPCDGVSDADSVDLIDSRHQGFAVVVTGGVGRESLPCSELEFPGEVSVVTSATACGLDVSWERARGASPSVTYNVYRDAGTPVPIDAAHLVGSVVDAQSWTDEDTGGLAWHYRVEAVDSCHDPGPRTVLNEGGDSQAESIVEPRLPGEVGASALEDACGVRVSWEPAIAAGPVTYRVYRALGSPVPLDAAHLVATLVDELSHVDTPPTGAFWRYRVEAEESCADPVPRRAANEAGDSEPVGIRLLVFPVDVTATPFECGMRLEWEEALGHGDVVYDVHRSGSSPVTLDASTLVVSDLTERSWIDGGWNGADRFYRVVARDLCDAAGNSGGDAGPVTPIDTTPPDFEGIVDTRDLGYCEVEVSWDESTASDNCSGVASYNVYRDHGVGNRGETLVASGVPGSPYIDTTPGNGTWVYVVRAVDGAGNEEQNEVFQQESENSCTNDFPEDAGMDDENGVDPPNGDGGNSFAPVGGGDLRDRLETRIERGGQSFHGNGNMRIAWNPSPSEGGLYPISYSVLRGDLLALADSGYAHALATPDSCGITEHETELPEQVDGNSYYYIVVPVSGDNATFGYDHLGVERPEATVCE